MTQIQVQQAFIASDEFGNRMGYDGSLGEVPLAAVPEYLEQARTMNSTPDLTVARIMEWLVDNKIMELVPVQRDLSWIESDFTD